jgi:hypothetical protein
LQDLFLGCSEFGVLYFQNRSRTFGCVCISRMTWIYLPLPPRPLSPNFGRGRMIFPRESSGNCLPSRAFKL